MDFKIDSATVYVPDGSSVDDAVARTTHMAISAHQDDIEIMAYHGVVECFGRDDRAFMGVVVTNGSGSPRDDLYADYTDEQMQKVRRVEQMKAAFVGEYCAQALLDFPSGAVKDAKSTDVVDDITQLLIAAKPKIVYTHNLADKHDTHVSVALRVISAIRALPKDARPEKLYSCEVWRNLDWTIDNDKVIFDVGAHENLAAALLGVFDSQICGGKRYDLAALGRRRANATFFASHGVDDSEGLTFGLDLTPLIQDDSIDPLNYITGYIDRFAAEVKDRLVKFA
ncbi:MAG: PIG-L family deacetylase [Armatimonadetes bacterium]|nr:PIG-L family deacetylase [Armatimonadota bacterium]